MGLFSFIQGVGKRLGLGTTATEADAAREPAPPAPSAAQLQQEVAALGLPAAGTQMRVEGNTVVLEGAALTDAGLREKLILALGNVAGVAQVDDRTNPDSTGAAEPASTFYTVKKGDTLSAIAKAQYGNANLYPRIFEANRPMLEHPDRIYPGQVLRIPPQA